MNLKIILFYIFTYLLPCSTYAQTEQDTVFLYYLGGQSNMQGFGFNKDLPTSLNKIVENVWIFQGNAPYDSLPNGGVGLWENLQAGHGVGFKSDGKKNQLSNRFGCELSLAETLTQKYPNRKIAFIKYARGGSMLDTAAVDYGGGYWEPDFKRENGQNQYDHLMATFRNAFANTDIDGDGKEEILIPKGIFWMQGENDAVTSEEISLRYYDNLKRLMFLIRAALHNPDLPVVIGKISDSFSSKNNKGGKVYPFGELVQYGQEKFVREDDNAAILRNTKNYNYIDNWHYQSKAYIDMGKGFAELILELSNSKK